MKLDRNINGTGHGKYGLLLVRRINEIAEHAKDGDAAKKRAFSVLEAITTLEREGIIEWGLPLTEGEFFVIKLRDEYARDALSAYATAARVDDIEYAKQIYYGLSTRAGPNSPFCKKPD